MAYVPNIVGKNEKLIGIARLHWIYIVSGTAWFLGLTYIGSMMQGVVERFAMFVSQTIDSVYLISMLMKLGDSALMITMTIGATILLFYILKVIGTEVALTERRVIHKSGIIFVKVREIDLEEIRGESLDLGTFGRMLNYGALHLDCRFIGDVKLPYIARAETFLKALHAHRAKTQDVLSIAVGKSNPQAIELVAEPPEQNPPGMPTPGTPPAPVQPVTPPVVPPVAPPEAPPQTPSVPETPQPPQTVPSEPVPTEVPAPPVIPPQVPSQPAVPQGQGAPSAQPANVTQAAVAEAVREMMPAMAQQVVKEMAEQGLLKPGSNPANDTGGEAEGPDDLVLAFDEAALQKKANARGSVFKTSYSVN